MAMWDEFHLEGRKVHVIPRHDIVPHDESPFCICGPTVEEHGDSSVIIHHSADGREKHGL